MTNTIVKTPKRILILTCLKFAIFLSNSIYYQISQADTAGTFESLVNRVEKTTLPNGIRVLYLERTLAPVFVGQVWVKVGSSDEEPGKSGAAHLLEHMAFKGTESIGTSDYNEEIKLSKNEDALHQLLLRNLDRVPQLVLLQS